MKTTDLIHVLLVEDNPSDVLLAQDALEEGGAFDLAVSERLGKALGMLKERPFDVVLLDLGLPDSQGLDTLISMRRDNPGLPVVVLTARDDEELALRAVHEGAQDYLVKSQIRNGALRRAIRYAIERRRAEATISESKARLEATLNSAMDAIVSVDERQCIVMFNPAAEELFGVPASEMMGKPLDSLIPERVRPHHNDHIRAFGETGVTSRHMGQLGRISGLRAGGEEFPIEASISQSRVAGEKIFTAIMRDISDRLRAEEMLHERAVLASLTADVGLAFTKGAALRETLQACVESMVRNLGAAFARIWTRSEAENVLELQASAGMYTHLDGPHSRVPVGKYKIGLIAEEREPHLTNDVAHDPRIGDPEWTRREGMVAFAGYPLQIQDRVVGVMAMFARRTLSGSVLGVMEAVANQIAVGIERIRAEESLRATKSRLQHVTSSSPAIVYLLQLDGEQVVSVWVSDNVRLLLGYDAQDIGSAQWWFDNLHPDDRGAGSRQIPDLIKHGQLTSEYRFRHHDGSYRWVRDQKRLLHSPTGQPAECVGSWTDITDRKGAESERDALLARLRIQIERMPLAYILLDADLRFIDWNPAAERTFGYSKEEAVRMHPFALISPKFRAAAEELIDRIRGGDMRAQSVNENVTKDGRTITCEWFNTPLFEGRRFSGILSLAQDVTERISLEAQLRQAQKMEAIGSLAGGVAHDFNNLLTIINGYSEIILGQLPADSPMRGLAHEIGQAGERAAGLTRQLLAFSRKQVLAPRVLDLNAVVTDTAKMLQRLIGEDIDLATALHPALGRVKADPGQVEQVLINLAMNARDAMPQGGKLTIETANAELDRTYTEAFPDLAPGPYLLLSVSDTGIGMDEATKTRIFEPFFTTKGEGKGTGLGLATVFGIVKQSGGHIAIYSEPGRGATFKVYLPSVEEGVPSGKSHPGLRTTPQGTETILLVEDEPALLALSRHILRSQGYTVLEATGGDKGIRIAEQHKGDIHLLVTDVVMPAMSGRQVAERISALRPAVKVLFLSGYTDDAVVRHGVLQAETAFLQKPFTPTGLAQKVRAVLDQPPQTAGGE